MEKDSGQLHLVEMGGDYMYPQNASFAFTIFDDTDWGTVTNLEPVYRFLESIGLRTTKSVWPLASDPNAPIGGCSLQERDYLHFVRSLRDNSGFEIALHNVRNSHSERSIVESGLNEYQELMGELPQIHCNHASNRDNIYWGSDRLSSMLCRFAYKTATFGKDRRFEGANEASPFFWGDLLQKNIPYVRNLVFPTINLLRVNPTLPYQDPTKPFVSHWFSSSEGANVQSFCDMISEENQDLLEAENGVCIMYTHFADGFVEAGQLNEQFRRQMRRLSAKNGWFVPVGELLDYLRGRREDCTISKKELRTMELAWLKFKLLRGSS